MIWNNLPSPIKDKTMVIEKELEIGELLNLYGQMDYFVATRLHSAVFSILNNVPVMAIGYEPKTIAIFNDLNIGDFVLDIRLISPSETNKMFEMLQRAPKEIFKAAKKQALIGARKNIEIMSNYINMNK